MWNQTKMYPTHFCYYFLIFFFLVLDPALSMSNKEQKSVFEEQHLLNILTIFSHNFAFTIDCNYHQYFYINDVTVTNKKNKTALCYSKNWLLHHILVNIFIIKRKQTLHSHSLLHTFPEATGFTSVPILW